MLLYIPAQSFEFHCFTSIIVELVRVLIQIRVVGWCSSQPSLFEDYPIHILTNTQPAGEGMLICLTDVIITLNLFLSSTLIYFFIDHNTTGDAVIPW